MTDFAKIIVVDGCQVLFYIEPDTESDDYNYKINQVVALDSFTMNLTIQDVEKKDALRYLDELDEEKARRILDTAKGFEQ